MQAQDIMTKAVATAQPTDPISKLIRIMTERRVSGVVVLDPFGGVAGMVTEGDLLRRTELGTEVHHSGLMNLLIGSGRLASEYVQAHSRKVEDIMTRDVAVVEPGTSLAEVVRLMEERKIKRVPVVDDGACVGIVSRADIVRALGAELEKQPPAAADDDSIRACLDRELKGSAWANHMLEATVADGRVELRGPVFHESEREALRVQVTNIPGVKSYKDELIWIEPLTGMVCSTGEQAQAV